MRTINAIQGSQEWHEIRAKHFTASEASAMMGCSKYQSRDDLLRLKKTGVAPEVTPQQQLLFDKGHAAEAAARPRIESLIGEDLYPVVGVLENTKLLASFDGLIMLGDIAFEHKLWNEDLAEIVTKIHNGEDAALPEHYSIQLDQQLLVSGAEKAIFVVSDGTPEKMVHCWYETTDDKKQALIDGWAQFEKDLADYVVRDAAPKVEGEYIPALPALRVTVVGQVTETNLTAYKDTAMAFIKSINTVLVTDQDFANAEKTVKFCREAEKELAQVKASALAQTASIDDLFRAVDDLSSAMRDKRLLLDKLVKTQKESIKLGIAHAAKEKLALAWKQMIEGLDAAIPAFCPVRIDLDGAMKGKKTISSLESAVNDEVARATIEATKLIKRFTENMQTINAEAADYRFLFNDIRDLIFEDPEAVKAIVIVRVADHVAREQLRLDAERERIANEERAKIQREQARIDAEKMRAEPVQAKEAAPIAASIAEEQKPERAAKSARPAATLQSTLDAWGKSKGLSQQDMRELFAILTEYEYRTNAA